MVEQERNVKAARTVSGITQVQAADIMGVSVPTYAAREKLPKAFSLDDLETLYSEFNDSGKKIIRDFVDDIFLSNNEY